MIDDETMDDMVCSAHAEVILPSRARWRTCGSLLRTRGGDPGTHTSLLVVLGSAPHTRR